MHTYAFPNGPSKKPHDGPEYASVSLNGNVQLRLIATSRIDLHIFAHFFGVPLSSLNLGRLILDALEVIRELRDDDIGVTRLDRRFVLPSVGFTRVGSDLTSATRMAWLVGMMKHPRSCSSDVTPSATAVGASKDRPTHAFTADSLIRLSLDTHELEAAEGDSARYMGDVVVRAIKTGGKVSAMRD